MSYLEEKQETMKDISEQIEDFKKVNPQVSDEQVNELVTNVAQFCMHAIVSNQEFNGRPENGWWTIRDTFDIAVKDESEMLIENRSLDNKLNGKFKNACYEADIEAIKEGLENGAQMNHDGDNSVLTDAAITGNLTTLKFFLEDDFVQHNNRYKKMMDFHNWKGDIFKKAYIYGQKEILQYLINEHNVEFTKEAKEVLSRPDPQSQALKKEVVNIMEKKYLKFMLDLNIEESVENKPKIRI